jgi:hypothetical protein
MFDMLGFDELIMLALHDGEGQMAVCARRQSCRLFRSLACVCRRTSPAV